MLAWSDVRCLLLHTFTKALCHAEQLCHAAWRLFIQASVSLAACQTIHINNCAVCREFHRGKLSKRLLNTGHVENMETVFLQKLKQQCGASFTQKMEGMCADLTTARGKQEDFQKWLVANVRHSYVLKHLHTCPAQTVWCSLVSCIAHLLPPRRAAMHMYVRQTRAVLRDVA